ncbi:MAG TPA: polysaccharide biosynthesis C-terminal domain-containing protein [Thermoleophilaceae bacterium]|nr:polysaccharide biosynthesis C-terminal domain-containing protein [Thermoleophilaceae bacterium]
MRPAGVAPSDAGAPGPGEARLLASGALVQGIAQAGGLFVLLVIVTVLARELTVAELGAYGLVVSLAGYLLVLRNSVANSAVRAMAAAAGEERARMFSATAVLYAAVGVATGLLIAGAALAIAAFILSGALADDARAGGLGLAAVTAAGIPATVWLDGLRAERRFVLAASMEILAVTLQLAVMLTLIFAGADLSVLIAVAGAIPLFSGTLCFAAVRRLGRRRSASPGVGGTPGTDYPLRLTFAGATRARVMAIVPTAGWLLVVELCNLAMYASSRVILGAYRDATTVGRFEGPVRAHNLLYALAGALAVPVVPTASRYVSAGDQRRLRDLVVRGTRYTLALFVPLCVTLMALAEPIVEVWLGARYTDGATALTILVSYWLLYGGLVVTPGFLVGAGRAREVALIVMAVATANLVLALVLTPELGLKGPALATAIPFVLAFPAMLALGLRTGGGVSVRELARQAWLPAYGLGTVLAAALVALRLAADPETLPAVLTAAVGGVLAFWLAFFVLVLEPSERALAAGLLRR